MNRNMSKMSRAHVAADQLVTFRASILALELSQRLSRDGKTIGSTAKADLSRYYVLLKIGRDGIAGVLHSNEMNLIVGGVYEQRRPELFDLGWWDYDAARMQKALLVAKVQDAVKKYPLERVHQADASVLMAKIQAMDDLQVAALVDTVERYWSVRPKTTTRAEGYAKAYAALDFITSDYIEKSEPGSLERATAMPITHDLSLIDTVTEVTNDAELESREDHKKDVLYVDTVLAGSRRRLVFGEIARHSLEELDDQQRANVITHLFASAPSWPRGNAEVRPVRDGVVVKSMVAETDLYVFVGDKPVSEGVRISTPMTAKA